ncbi:MAG: hypothetical protein QM610_08050 [Chitinophagaceae bacterium]
MATITEREWQTYFFQLDEVQKKSVVLLLKSFLKDGEQPQIDIVQYNREIEEALADIDAGNHLTQEELEKQASRW